MKRISHILIDFKKKFDNNHALAYSASASFFFFISLIPMLSLMLAFLPYTGISFEVLRHMLLGIVPEEITGIIDEILKDISTKSISVISISILGIVASSAGGIVALTNALNIIYDVEVEIGFLAIRIRAIICEVAAIFFIQACLLLMMVTKNGVYTIIELFPSSRMFWLLILHTKWILSIFGTSVLFALLYFFLPNRKNSSLNFGLFCVQLPGAFLSAILCALSIKVLGLLIKFVGLFGTYGSLSSPALLQLWILIQIVIILLGAQVNYSTRNYWYWTFGKIKESKLSINAAGTQIHHLVDKALSDSGRQIKFRGELGCKKGLELDIISIDKNDKYTEEALYYHLTDRFENVLKQQDRLIKDGIITITDVIDKEKYDIIVKAFEYCSKEDENVTLVIAASEIAEEDVDIFLELDDSKNYPIYIFHELKGYEHVLLNEKDAILDINKSWLYVEPYSWTRRRYHKKED